MTTWKITFVSETGKYQELICKSKREMIYQYLEFHNVWGWKASELKAWKNERDYTETLNRFLEK